MGLQNFVHKDWQYEQDGDVCSIADVHHSKLEEHFPLFPLDVFISFFLFTENQSVSPNEKRPSWSSLGKVKCCLVAVVENSPVSGRIALFPRRAEIYPSALWNEALIQSSFSVYVILKIFELNMVRKK